MCLDKLKLQKNIKGKAEAKALPKILWLVNLEKQVDILLLQNSSQAYVIQSADMIDNDEDIENLCPSASEDIFQEIIDGFQGGSNDNQSPPPQV